MKLAIVALFLSFYLAQSSDTNEDLEPYSSYDEARFEELVPSEPHFIMFFAPWCGHCKALRPTWKLLEEHYNVKETGTIKVAEVDCTKQRSLCSKNGVTGYPTLKLFMPEKEAIRHRGARDIQSLKNFVTQSLQGGGESPKTSSAKHVAVEGLHDLTVVNFEEHVAVGHHFVKFYAPWCGHCQMLEPKWKQLAIELKDRTDVSIARVDCTTNRQLCETHKIRIYPTLLWFENGEQSEQYQGARSVENLLEMVTKMTGKEHVITKEEEKEVVELPVVEKAETLPEPTVVEGLTELTADSFESAITESDGIFINFFAPWCGVCKRLEPAWNELAEYYQDNDNIKIARVDCTKHSSVCQLQGIRGYPTLKFFRNGQEEKGGPTGRDINNLKTFVDSKLENIGGEDEEDEEGLRELTENNFGKVIEYGVTFVKFYAPWCGHCKRLAPTWDELALDDFSDAQAPVVIAKVDCTKFRSICTTNQVQGYPTLILFVDGEQAGTYPGHEPRTREAFKKYILETSDRYLSDNPPRDEL